MHLIIILLILINLFRNTLYNMTTNYLESITNTNEQKLSKCEIKNIAFLNYSQDFKILSKLLKVFE